MIVGNWDAIETTEAGELSKHLRMMSFVECDARQVLSDQQFCCRRITNTDCETTSHLTLSIIWYGFHLTFVAGPTMSATLLVQVRDIPKRTAMAEI